MWNTGKQWQNYWTTSHLVHLYHCIQLPSCCLKCNVSKHVNALSGRLHVPLFYFDLLWRRWCGGGNCIYCEPLNKKSCAPDINHLVYYLQPMETSIGAKRVSYLSYSVRWTAVTGQKYFVAFNVCRVIAFTVLVVIIRRICNKHIYLPYAISLSQKWLH